MMRVPPGRLGLVILAAALVPIAIKKWPKVVRAVGREVAKAGEGIQKLADEVENYKNGKQEAAEKAAAATAESAPKEEPKKASAPKNVKQQKPAAPKAKTVKARPRRPATQS